MKPNADMIVRVLKRLKAAIGYHELGMTQHALRCLDSLTELGKIGPFGLVAEVLRGEILKGQEKHLSAAKALEIVACMLPTPARHAIRDDAGCLLRTGQRRGTCRQPPGCCSRCKARSSAEACLLAIKGGRPILATLAPTLLSATISGHDLQPHPTRPLALRPVRFRPGNPGRCLAGPQRATLVIILMVIAAIFALCGLVFGSLTICDEGDYLALRFGPLPLLCKRIRYADITGVEIGRTRIIDGWGIHYFPAAAGPTTSGASPA